MPNPNKTRKGILGDSPARDIFQAMGQGSMGKHPHQHGLFGMMGQARDVGHVKPKPGRTASSIARSMGQGGK